MIALPFVFLIISCVWCSWSCSVLWVLDEVKAAVSRYLGPLLLRAKGSLSCSRALQPACWWCVYIHWLFLQGKLLLTKQFLQPLDRPAITYYTTCFWSRQSNCLAWQLICPNCIPAASSITQSPSLIQPQYVTRCISAQMRWRNMTLESTKPSQQQFLGWSKVLVPTDKPQMHIYTHKLLQTELYFLIWFCSREQDSWQQGKCRPMKVQQQF